MQGDCFALGKEKKWMFFLMCFDLRPKSGVLEVVLDRLWIHLPLASINSALRTSSTSFLHLGFVFLTSVTIFVEHTRWS
ncbi:hypothetical protein XELAEV_18011137mg [Xenopus laevis]|uniref:Uncharacterized protein n=1 Tax=Xenopus laevis TaxID=8355 RepID=A0A974DWP0_XENLA|nr:hypothetical protein XELAEV_18011137mg [Xenopus laevis]